MQHMPSLHLYRARYVMPISAPIIEDGAVVVADGIILAVAQNKALRRDYPQATYYDLGEVILMPGLINSHCHLDYTMMRGQLASGSSFTSWVQELNKIKFALQEKDFLAAIEEGARELYSCGCTTVCNIESFPELLSKPIGVPLRFWQFLEVMDIRDRQQGVEGLARAEDFLKKKNDKKINFGISPHAPQTTSQGLYREARDLAEKNQIPFCTHLAESEEEFEMFTRGSGVLFDFLKNFGRTMSDCGFQTPVQAVLQNDLLPQGSLLVHMNVLNEKDRELLAARAADFFIVHCPKTHRFFERPAFDWKFFYKNQYRLLLGTDSLASNDSLNLFEEMQLMSVTAPELAPEEILKMVTLYPAEALKMRQRLGVLCSGAFADMIAIPFDGKIANVAAAALHNTNRPFYF